MKMDREPDPGKTLTKLYIEFENKMWEVIGLPECAGDVLTWGFLYTHEKIMHIPRG